MTALGQPGKLLDAAREWVSRGWKPIRNWRYRQWLRQCRLPIESGEASGAGGTRVDDYWGQHTIASSTVYSRATSLSYMRWIDANYPRYFDLCGLYLPHPDQVLLDYGCGPGNDLCGFSEFSKARRIIGLDISRKALEQARYRLFLHGVDGRTVRLMQISDTSPTIPLPSDSVDYFQSLGVLHHVSDPAGVLREIRRVLRPGAQGRIMVYHRGSLYLHLVIPYLIQIVQGRYPGISSLEAFARIADSGAPIARSYHAGDFLALVREAGFEGRFLGAAFGEGEVDAWRRYSQEALRSPRFPPEHKAFLRDVTADETGYPVRGGLHAGLSAVFEAKKPA